MSSEIFAYSHSADACIRRSLVTFSMEKAELQKNVDALKKQLKIDRVPVSKAEAQFIITWEAEVRENAKKV